MAREEEQPPVRCCMCGRFKRVILEWIERWGRYLCDRCSAMIAQRRNHDA